MGRIRFIQKIREQINLKIYNTKFWVVNGLRFFRLLVSLSMIGLMVYFYGFPHEQSEKDVLTDIFRLSFLFFIVSYVLRLFYDFEPGSFIRRNRLEGILLLVVLLDFISNLFFAKSLFRLFFNQLATQQAEDLFSIFTQFYMLLIVGIEMAKASRKITAINLSPPILFILSFVILILSGSGLLMLPECSIDGTGLSFTDALFTSTSASCVTGLIVEDTATYFTLKGKFLILILIQMGGLNIISFATFFAAFGKKGVGLRHQLMIKDFMSYENLENTSSLLKRVILMTLFIEVLGAVFIFFAWSPDLQFESLSDKIFHSVFHAVSAFNNAGFSTYTNGMYEPLVRDSYIVHIILALLIILGGLGVPIMHDLFGVKSLRARMKLPWKKLNITTRLAVYTSLILIVLGAAFFFAIESQNPRQHFDQNLMDQHVVGQVVMSFFQSVSVRTAGFNSVDISILSPPTLMFFILFMFVGASPGGTGGGIKTTTFALIFLNAISTIRGKKNTEVFRQNIGPELLNKAFSIFLFSASFIVIAALGLMLTDPDIEPLHLIFEEVSAFATVGLSVGITSAISDPGKYILIFSMLVGRVGVLTLAYALSTKAISNNYKYPDAFVMVG